jgi:regulator of sirC expression with transglutaminase-like and TPR domain
MEKWHEAETHARKVLEFNPSDVKALYRRALARIQLQNYEAASHDLKHAKAVCEEKNDKEQLALVAKEIQRLAVLSKDSLAKEKQIYSKLFS